MHVSIAGLLEKLVLDHVSIAGLLDHICCTSSRDLSHSKYSRTLVVKENLLKVREYR